MNATHNTLYAAAGALALVLSAGTGVRAADDDTADPSPPEIAEDAGGEQSTAAGEGSDTSRTIGPATRVRTHEEFGQTITEYERGGKVFLMTVKPRVGPTQYWSDPDGDGQFQNQDRGGIDDELNLPKWRLGGW